MSTAVEIACRDGVRLAGDHFPAVGDAQGSIVVACALGVRRAFYQRFAVLAAASGYEVLLFSYRGSEGDDPAVASYRLADWGREDIDAALAWCRARAPELPRYFVGHSIGAQLLGLAGQASGLSGAAFVAGSFPYWRRWRGRQRWQMFGLFCVAVPLLTGLLRRFPSRFFGLGSLDMPSHFMRDWARWVRQPDYLLAPRFGLQRQGYEALDIPVASFLFEDDDYVPWAAAEKLHRSMPRRTWSCVARDGPRGSRAFSGCSATRRCRRSCSTTSGSCPTRRKPRPSVWRRQSPVATGRRGSVIHSLHEPA
ncbi:alpha/beta fold hydrolase [Pseudomonas aeruginosa]|nr:alpha/beta fold hydrolase [Pseudomonas aeruginosa]